MPANFFLLMVTAVRIFLVALLVCQGPAAPAATLPEGSAQLRISRIDISTEVDADLGARTETLIERQALSERGSELVGNYVMAYDKGLEHLQIVEAFTRKPDGRRLPVAGDGIQQQDGSPGGSQAAGWPGTVWIKVRFPDVQAGDTTVIRTLQTTRFLPLDGWFSIYDFLSPDYAYDSYRFRLTAPSGFALRAVGSALAVQSEEAGGRQIWTIQGATPALGLEPQAVDTLSIWPHIVGSSLPTHERMAEAYARKNPVAAQSSAEALKLVDRLTWGMKEPRAKAQVLYEWVRDNIRAVDFSLGAGGWQAHGVDWILINRYGDSKDHALLLQALLRAAGVPAVPALINTGEQYRLPELPSRYSFNHVMVYLPTFGLFADSTAADMPLGELPWYAQDKPVAVALAQGGQLLHTPASTASKNTLTSRARWKIADSGNATLDLRVDASGLPAAELQDRLQQLRAQAGNQLAQQILEASGFKGRGSIQVAPLQGDRRAQPLQLQLELRGMLADKAQGVISPNPPLSALPVGIRAQYDFAAATRTYSQRCVPLRVREEFEMQFSPAFAIARVPDNVVLQGDDGVRFSAEYWLEGNTLTGVRTLELTQARHVCTPQDYAARKPVFDQITRQLKSTLLYQQ